MKTAWLGIVLLAATASAQMLRPNDLHQRAEASDKNVDLPTLKLETIAQPTRSEPVSPLSNKMREPAGSVADKMVDIPSSLSYSTVATSTIPHQNFTAKRAVLGDNRPASPTVKTTAAKINQRVIRPLTPAGEEELKKQLNSPH
jgi:hypothetical protein